MTSVAYESGRLRGGAGSSGAQLWPARPRWAAMALLAAGAAMALLLWGLPVTAHADDGSVFVAGGAVHPMANSDIRMEAETVQTVCYGRFAEYRAEFHFVNEGEPQTVRLGFPFADSSKTSQDRPSLVAFRVWQDGSPLPVTVGRGEDPAWPGSEITYYLHEATFPRGGTVITVRYLADVSSVITARFSDDAPAALGPPGVSGTFDYWLHSGAGWSGTIGKAVIRFDLADTFAGWGLDIKRAETEGYEVASFTTSPESYVTLGERTYQWVFEELEPTTEDDIVLAFTLPQRRYDAGLGLTWSDPRLAAIQGSGRVGAGSGAAAETTPAGWEAFDGSVKTSWGAPAPGIGAWTRADFDGPRTLREIRILPGRHDDVDSFAKYGRPKTLRMTCSDGTDRVLQLQDEPSLQRFVVSSEATWVRFDTLAVYPGRASADVYISEIELGSLPAPGFQAFSELITAPVTGSPSTGPAAVSGTVISPVSTEPTASSTTALSVATATTTALPPSAQSATATSSPPAAAGERGAGTQGGGWLWPAFVAIGVALVALLAAVALERRTRKRVKG